MAPPVIALLTDFGLRDHYAGTMKGVILGICPTATLVDISHDVPPHDVLTGAMELAAAYRYFPIGTVFLVVVDPGVGSARQAIAVEMGGYTFVAPNNGVLSGVQDELPVARAVELTDPRYQRPILSRTFEGRDRFAPAAAWRAAGVDVGAFGPPVSMLCRLDIPQPTCATDGVAGQVLRVDRFGNLISNIDGGLTIVTTYADVAPGDVGALFGSTGHLEIAAYGASASTLLNLHRGAPVRVARRA